MGFLKDTVVMCTLSLKNSIKIVCFSPNCKLIWETEAGHVFHTQWCLLLHVFSAGKLSVPLLQKRYTPSLNRPGQENSYHINTPLCEMQLEKCPLSKSLEFK